MAVFETTKAFKNRAGSKLLIMFTINKVSE